MHELAIVQDILEIVAAKSGGAGIARVVLEVGKLSAVLPSAIRFCFDLCAEGTPAEGAALEILEPPGRARCRSCATEFALDRPFGRCACGGTDLEWLGGDELTIRSLELA